MYFGEGAVNHSRSLFLEGGVFEYKPREMEGISVFIFTVDTRHFHQSNTVSSA